MPGERAGGLWTVAGPGSARMPQAGLRHCPQSFASHEAPLKIELWFGSENGARWIGEWSSMSTNAHREAALGDVPLPPAMRKSMRRAVGIA